MRFLISTYAYFRNDNLKNYLLLLYFIQCLMNMNKKTFLYKKKYIFIMTNIFNLLYIYVPSLDDCFYFVAGILYRENIAEKNIGTTFLLQ